MDPNTRNEPRSYPVPTPSAVKGVFKAIYGKPEIEWIVERITVVNPPRFESVTYRMDYDKGIDDRYGAGGEEKRKTLQTWTFLRDVEYEFQARFEVLAAVGIQDEDVISDMGGWLKPELRGLTKAEVNRIYNAQILDRMLHGRQFKTPTLGKNECPATWEAVSVIAPPSHGCALDFEGMVLLDLIPRDIHGDKYTPRFTRAGFKSGVWDLTTCRDVDAQQSDNLKALVTTRLAEYTRRNLPHKAPRKTRSKQ
jgi:CRISPR-associated protein Cas5d